MSQQLCFNTLYNTICFTTQPVNLITQAIPTDSPLPQFLATYDCPPTLTRQQITTLRNGIDIIGIAPRCASMWRAISDESVNNLI